MDFPFFGHSEEGGHRQRINSILFFPVFSLRFLPRVKEPRKESEDSFFRSQYPVCTKEEWVKEGQETNFLPWSRLREEKRETKKKGRKRERKRRRGRRMTRDKRQDCLPVFFFPCCVFLDFDSFFFFWSLPYVTLLVSRSSSRLLILSLLSPVCLPCPERIRERETVIIICSWDSMACVSESRPFLIHSDFFFTLSLLLLLQETWSLSPFV